MHAIASIVLGWQQVQGGTARLQSMMITALSTTRRAGSPKFVITAWMPGGIAYLSVIACVCAAAETWSCARL